MKILVSGCSYTQHKSWPSQLLSPKKVDVKNVGAAGFGNNYISNSITANLDYNPDFVFVLWSGINRMELRVPNTKLFSDRKILGSGLIQDLENSVFYASAGRGALLDRHLLSAYNDIKAPDWPKIKNINDWFELPEWIRQECVQKEIHLSVSSANDNVRAFVQNYFLVQYLNFDVEYLSELTFQNMANCFNFLERLRIPYRFSFIYDIFSKNTFFSLGACKKEKYFNHIDWSKYIDLTPYEYGIRHDLLGQDDYHLTDQGLNQWALEINDRLKQDKSLANLFA